MGDTKTTKKHLNCVSLRIFIFGYTDFKYLLFYITHFFLDVFISSCFFLVFCYFHPLILLFYVFRAHVMRESIANSIAYTR